MVVHIVIFVITAFCWSAQRTFSPDHTGSDSECLDFACKISLSNSKFDHTFRRQPMQAVVTGASHQLTEQGRNLLICPLSVPYDFSPKYPQPSFFSSFPCSFLHPSFFPSPCASVVFFPGKVCDQFAQWSAVHSIGEVHLCCMFWPYWLSGLEL